MYNSKFLITISLLFSFLLPSCKSAIKLGVGDDVSTSSIDDEAYISQVNLMGEQERIMVLSFLKAAKEGDICAVRQLLERGADPNITIDQYKNNPLHIASAKGYLEIVKLILANINNIIDINQPGQKGCSALYLAAGNGHEEVAKYLLNNGADPNIPNEYGNTSLLHIASAKGCLEIVKLILANINNIIDINQPGQKGCSALYLAVGNGHEEVAKYLLNNGAAPNITDEYGNNPLHIASAKGYLEIVKLILANINNIIDINQPDKKGFTALHLAVGKDHEEVAKYLLNNGAAPNIPDEDGNNTLHTASAKGYVRIAELILNNHVKRAVIDEIGEGGFTALHLAAGNGHKEVVEMLLNYGADPNIPDEDGYNALHTASLKGYLRIVELILNNHLKRAVIDETSSEGFTALHLAVNNCHEEVVGLLLNHGADPNIPDEYGDNTLHTASLKGYLRIVELILNSPIKRVVIDEIGEGGFTALHLAVSNFDEELVKYLLNNGANPNITNGEGDSSLDILIENDILDFELILNHSTYPIDFNVIDKNGVPLFHKIIYYGNDYLSLLETIISKGEVNVNQVDQKGYTPLHAAASLGRLNYLEMLIKHGADINIQDDGGNTFLHLLVSSKYSKYEYLIEVIEFIISNLHMVCLSNLKEYLNDYPYTEGMLIIMVDYIQAIDCNLVNNEGKTVLDIIKEKVPYESQKYSKTIEILKKQEIAGGWLPVSGECKKRKSLGKPGYDVKQPNTKRAHNSAKND